MGQEKRIGPRLYHYLAALLGGAALGFFIQYRKFELEFDTFLNVRLIILCLLCSLAALWSWKIQAFVLSFLFSALHDKSLNRLSFSYGGLILFLAYPLARRFVFTDWQTSFRLMAVSVLLSIFIMQIIILILGLRKGEGANAGHEGAESRAIKRQFKEAHGARSLFAFLLALACMGFLYYQHQVSYSNAFIYRNQEWSNITVNNDTRLATTLPLGGFYEFPEKIQLVPGSDVVFDIVPVDSHGMRALNRIVDLELVGKNGEILERQSVKTQIQKGWEELRFTVDSTLEERISLKVRFSAVKGETLNEFLRGMGSYLFPPWHSSLLRVGLTRARVAAKKDAEFSNVILISIDTLRADHVDSHEDTMFAPAMTALAKDGIAFRNVIATATWTLPSHMSMLTSLYPSYHGVDDKEYKISYLPFKTLAGVFQENGYATAAFTGAGFVSARYGFSKGFDSFYEEPQGIDKRDENDAKLIFDRAKGWIEQHADRRFFLFLHTFEAHHYVYARQRHRLFADTDYEGAFESSDIVKTLFSLQAGRDEDTIEMEDVQFLKDVYAGAISLADKELDHFLEFLKSNNLYQDTLIVLTSDHGESFGEVHSAGERTWHHGDVPYEEQVRVPLILKPARKNAQLDKLVFDQRVSLIDVAPTILDICDLPIPEQFRGSSLMALLSKGEYEPDRKIFAEESQGKLGGRLDSIVMYSGNNVYLFFPHPDREDELYDIRKDPGQLKARKDMNTAEEMQKAVSAYLDASKQYRKIQHEKQALPKEFEEQLRALGYLQ